MESTKKWRKQTPAGGWEDNKRRSIPELTYLWQQVRKRMEGRASAPGTDLDAASPLIRIGMGGGGRSSGDDRTGSIRRATSTAGARAG